MPPRPKILLYVHALAIGGAERVMVLLANAFCDRGCEVVLALDGGDRALAPLLAASVRIVPLAQGQAASVWGLRALLRSERPNASLSALGSSNVKHVAAALLAGRLGRCCLSYHGFAQSEPQPLSALAYWLAPLLTRLAGATVAVSRVLRQALIAKHGAASRRVHTIVNPVVAAGAIAPPSRAELAARPPLVVACGRLAPIKNFVALVEAFAQVRPKQARLMIVGEGPERAAIEEAITRTGQVGRVELAGFVAEPRAIYDRAACVVVSSLSEAFSLTTVEALACGLPVVATRCGGPEEILDAGDYGTLVAVGDGVALAEAISEALAERGDPAPRAKRARDFTIERAAQAYLALFADLARPHTPFATVLRP